MFKKVIGTLIVIATFLLVAQPAKAVSSAPSFPSCLNPQGTLIANYPDGVHGIPGDATTHTGSDKVYAYTGDQTLQCFCEVDGTGIQTNWLKVSSYPQEQIDSLIASGWVYIADGSAWGLDPVPYVAQNHAYSCLSVGGSDTPKKNKSHKKSSSKSSHRSSSPAVGGSVLGASTVMGQVLGLASTGNSKVLYNMWLGGLLMLTIGVWLKWLKQQQLRKKS